MTDLHAFIRSVSLTAAIAMAATGCSPKQSQKVLAGGIEVTSASFVVTFDEPMHATYPWTEILLEAELPSGEPGALLAQAQEAGLKVALVQAGGQELPLVLSFVNQYLEASSPALQWPKEDLPPFVSLKLRANKRITFARVIWFGYDPSASKSGTMLPDPGAGP